MSCKIVEDFCQDCGYCHCHPIPFRPPNQQLESKDLPKKNISCKHLADVCEKCLEKVQTSSEEEEEDLPPLPTAKEKINRIFWDFSFLAAGGVVWYLTTKWCSNLAIECFHSILDTLATPTE